MDGDQLKQVPGVRAAPPADEVDLAVADALLPGPLPPALRAFLSVCDGALAGDVELFGSEGITEATNNGTHSWQMAVCTLVVGRAGPGRSLVMTGDRDEVYEVDDDPWDSRTMEIAADTPLDLFLRHRGRALRHRDRWWAMPALAECVEEVRARFTRDVDELLSVGIAAQIGEPLPQSLVGFRPVDAALAWELIASEKYQMFLVNYRPDPPGPGPSAAMQWQQACEAITEPQHEGLRDLIRHAPLPESITALGYLGGDEEMTVADSIRHLAFLALLAKARDDLAVLVRGDEGTGPLPGRRLAHIYLVGHVPVSLTSAI